MLSCWKLGCNSAMIGSGVCMCVVFKVWVLFLKSCDICWSEWDWVVLADGCLVVGNWEAFAKGVFHFFYKCPDSGGNVFLCC